MLDSFYWLSGREADVPLDHRSCLIMYIFIFTIYIIIIIIIIIYDIVFGDQEEEIP